MSIIIVLADKDTIPVMPDLIRHPVFSWIASRLHCVPGSRRNGEHRPVFTIRIYWHDTATRLESYHGIVGMGAEMERGWVEERIRMLDDQMRPPLISFSAA